jgi:hypothetical protein
MRRLLVPLFVLAVFHALPSRADGPEGIDGKRPDKILRGKKGADFKVYVAYEGFVPLVHPDKEGRVTLKEPIAFMQPFYVAAIHQPEKATKKQTFFYLVTTADRETPKDHIGWVPGEYLVRGREAEVLPTGIVRKVLIVNRQGELPKEEKLDEVRIRHAPRPEVKGKDEPFRLYTPMFVYGEADGYVLVGDAPAFSSLVTKKPTDVVMGWLPKTRVEPWATREAL